MVDIMKPLTGIYQGILHASSVDELTMTFGHWCLVHVPRIPNVVVNIVLRDNAVKELSAKEWASWLAHSAEGSLRSFADGTEPLT